MRGAWFQNRSAGGTVRFSLRGLDYVVPVGQAVELPAELAWYPKAVGLLLEPCVAPSDTAARAVGPEPTPRPSRRRYPDGVSSGPEPAPREEREAEELDVPEIAPEVSESLARRKRR